MRHLQKILHHSRHPVTAYRLPTGEDPKKSSTQFFDRISPRSFNLENRKLSPGLNDYSARDDKTLIDVRFRLPQTIIHCELSSARCSYGPQELVRMVR